MVTKTSRYHAEFHFGGFYHIFNRANSNNDLLFITDGDMSYFLRRLKHYIDPIAYIYAYCLLPNHFHLVIQLKHIEDLIKSNDEQVSNKIVTQAFSNLFNSYSKTFNKVHSRRGRLFGATFKKVAVKEDSYKRTLINYIHRNPEHHNYCQNYESWRFSSYKTILSNNKTSLKRKEVIELFGSIEEFVEFHLVNRHQNGDRACLLE